MMNEQKKNEVTLYELYDLSCNDDIDGDVFEIIGEDEAGNEGSWECSIQDLAGKAHDLISQQAARIVELECLAAEMAFYCEQLSQKGELKLKNKSPEALKYLMNRYRHASYKDGSDQITLR